MSEEEYAELFGDDPAMKKRAELLGKKVRGFSEFVLSRLPDTLPAGSLSGKVTYHDPCHMSRYQGVVKEPRDLLKKMSGLTYAEMPEADRCCGAAGSYNIMHYEQSMKVLEHKNGKPEEDRGQHPRHRVPGLHDPIELRSEASWLECQGCSYQ